MRKNAQPHMCSATPTPPPQKRADLSTALRAAHATLRRERQLEATGHIERHRAAASPGVLSQKQELQ